MLRLYYNKNFANAKKITIILTQKLKKGCDSMSMTVEERTKALKNVVRLKRRLEVAKYIDDKEEIRNLETLIENLEADLEADESKKTTIEDILTVDTPF